jgi:hypothetical protein
VAFPGVAVIAGAGAGTATMYCDVAVQPETITPSAMPLSQEWLDLLTADNHFPNLLCTWATGTVEPETFIEYPINPANTRDSYTRPRALLSSALPHPHG